MKSEPLHVVIAHKIRKKIFSIEDRTNFRLESERELCRQMGVSSITIRRAIKNLMAEGIVTSRRGSGTYISDEVISGSRTIAVLIGHHDEGALESPWHSKANREFQRLLKAAGWHVRTYVLYHGNECRDERVMDILEADVKSHKIAGILSFLEFQFLRDGFKELLEELELPYLNFDYKAETNSAIVDYYSLGTMAVRWFHDNGVRDIGIIANSLKGNSYSKYSADYFGFRNSLMEFSELSTRDEWCCSIQPSISNGISAFKKIWALPEKPRGILVGDEVAFIGVAMAMTELGLRHPQDLMIVSHCTAGSASELPIAPVYIAFDVLNYAAVVVDQIMRMVQHKILVTPTIRVSPMLAGNVGSKKDAKKRVNRNMEILK